MIKPPGKPGPSIFLPKQQKGTPMVLSLFRLDPLFLLAFPSASNLHVESGFQVLKLTSRTPVLGPAWPASQRKPWETHILHPMHLSKEAVKKGRHTLRCIIVQSRGKDQMKAIKEHPMGVVPLEAPLLELAPRCLCLVVPAATWQL